jgi:formiminotetrahydrofolate cyclodeaminase
MFRMHSLTVDELLDELARDAPVPGAGPAAALACASAAALVAMAARSSCDGWDEGRAAAAQADCLRRRAVELAQEDAEAVEAFVAARTAPRSDEHQHVRDFRLGRTLERAAEVPLELAEAAADVAILAAHASARCRGDVRPDAGAAAQLAYGAARAAAHLVEVNLAAREGDERVEKARAAVRAARAAAEDAARVD